MKQGILRHTYIFLMEQLKKMKKINNCKSPFSFIAITSVQQDPI